MTEVSKKWIREQARFKGIFDSGSSDGNCKDGGFDKTIPLSSVQKYEECLEYMKQACEAGFDGSQRKKFEEELAVYMGLDYAVALTSGEAALHFALKLAAEKLFGTSTGIYTPGGTGSGCLTGKKVFCSDFTTADMVNPIVFEGGDPVFIDCAEEHWCMDPEVLELAFQKYRDVKIVVLSEPYGFPGDVWKIRQICSEQGALLIECAGDSFGAEYRVNMGEPDNKEGEPNRKEMTAYQTAEESESARKGISDSKAEDSTGIWAKAGTLGDYCVLDFGGEKILGGYGGALLTRDRYSADKAAYWAGGAKVSTPWLQHEELGYSCILGDPDAAFLRGVLAHIDEVIAKKEKIYQKYFEKLDGALAYVIPVAEGTKPNYFMTAMTCESNIQFMETRNDRNYTYQDIHGTAAPMEIYDALQAFGAECAPVCKPMSMQPVYRNNEHFTLDGPWRMYESFRNDTFWLRCDMARQYYESGIVLPSDVGMTPEEQDKVIDIIYACYDKAEMDRMVWV